MRALRFGIHCADIDHDRSVSTLRSAIELKNVFEQIQAAERAGNLSPEERRRLEEQAAEKGLQALFKVGHILEDTLFHAKLFPGH